MKALWIIASSLLCVSCSQGEFSPPDAKARKDAIGPTRSLSPLYQQIFHPWDGFDPIPAPGPSDWLANHKEPGQTAQQFAKSRPNRPDEQRNTIYIRPLGTFPQNKHEVLNQVAAYAAIFFQLEVKILDPIPIGDAITSRKNAFTQNTQLLTTDILKLLRQNLPRDAYCQIAVTMTDLYPDPKWNFVFGQASLRNRVGVYSFARYVEGFPNPDPETKPTPLFLRRCMKVFVHETGHMFGIQHCIYFSCVMNGSNHQQESDSRDVHLCPVCLRKLGWSTEFDPMKRYRELQAFYDKHALKKESEWLSRRLQAIESDKK